MKYHKLYLVLPLLVTSSVYAYDYGDPTAAEQTHLEALNRARANPTGEATRLGLSSVFEGVPSGKITGEPLPPLASNAQLLQAARAHSADMLARDYFDHYSPEKVGPGDRIKNAGYQAGWWGENIAITASSNTIDIGVASLSLHDQLFVDDGIEGRGHRTNILSSNFKEVGAGLATGQQKQGDWIFNAYNVTVDFGANVTDSRSILTGVAYDDLNKNNQYDMGEGISGVQVTATETGETTTTATAGGYGLPLTAGQYTITLTHSSLGSMTRTVTIGDQNVKLDILASDFSSAVVDPIGTPTTNSNNPVPVDPTGNPTTTDDQAIIIAKAQCVSAGKAYIQSFANMTDGCYGLPNEPTEVVANVIYLDTNRTVAPASFRGGILVNNTFVKSTKLGKARLPNTALAFNYQPVTEHVGLTADLLVAVGIEKPVTLEAPQYDGSFDTNYFAFTENVGSIFPVDLYVDSSGWGTEVAKMQAQPYLANVTLETMQTVVLVPGDLTSVAQMLTAQDISQAMLYFFIGYALSDGTIVFNERPIIVNIE